MKFKHSSLAHSFVLGFSVFFQELCWHILIYPLFSCIFFCFLLPTSSSKLYFPSFLTNSLQTGMNFLLHSGEGGY